MLIVYSCTWFVVLARQKGVENNKQGGGGGINTTPPHDSHECYLDLVDPCSKWKD